MLNLNGIMETKITGCDQPYTEQKEEKYFSLPNKMTVDCTKARYFYGGKGPLKSRRITGFNGTILFGKVYKLANLKEEAKRNPEEEYELSKIIEWAQENGFEWVVHTPTDDWYAVSDGDIVISN